MNQRAMEIGEIIETRFKNLMKTCDSIGDVRGIGAMTGIEFVIHSDPRKPNTALCAEIVKGCAARGLILLSAGVRLVLPLRIS